MPEDGFGAGAGDRLGSQARRRKSQQSIGAQRTISFTATFNPNGGSARNARRSSGEHASPRRAGGERVMSIAEPRQFHLRRALRSTTVLFCIASVAMSGTLSGCAAVGGGASYTV